MAYSDYTFPVIRGDVERALRGLKRMLGAESVFKSVKENRYFVPPAKKIAAKKAASRKAKRTQTTRARRTY